MTKKGIIPYIREHKYVLLALYWPIHILWYFILVRVYGDADVLLIQSPLDAYVPFCEWFALPYVVWYPYIAAVFFAAYRSGKRDYIRAVTVVSLCAFLPMVFCTLVPNGLPLSIRPDFTELGRSNICTWMVNVIYENDSPPRSVMPSMHVSVSLALAFSFLRCAKYRKGTLLRLGSVVLSLLIALSTVFIKQHSVLDLIAGTGTAIVVCVAAVIVERQLDKRKNKSGSKPE